MSVVKRRISIENLLGTYLSFTPKPTEVDLFYADIRTLNTTLLHDAIEECLETQKLSRGGAEQQRAEIYRVYIRKTKELASLYPFIFAVESALRSAAAEHYPNVFRSSDWWTVIRDKYNEGGSARDFQKDKNGKMNIRGIKVNPAFIKSLFSSIEKIGKKNSHFIQGNDNTDELYSCITLNDLCKIIHSDWEISKGMFYSYISDGNILDKKYFIDNTNNIIKTRNELFHSNPVKERAKIYRSCEKILDTLGFHIGTYDENLRQSQYIRTTPEINICNRHIIPARIPNEIAS